MPRLTNARYLAIHKWLNRIWLHERSIFGYLSPEEQWELHDYFRPTEELKEVELLAHRRKITAERPSIPHQAGRSLAKLNRTVTDLLRDQQESTATPTRKLPALSSVVNPDLDFTPLVKLLVNQAWREVMEEYEWEKGDPASEHGL